MNTQTPVKDACPLCGRIAVDSITVFGAKLIGCPCVGERSWAFCFEHVALPVARGDRLAFYNTGHDPGDEDRSP